MSWFKKNKNIDIVNTKSESSNNSYIGNGLIQLQNQGIHKSFFPNFLYKPPFGYPRGENLYMARILAKNPYIYGIIKGLCDEVSSTNFDIVYKKEREPTPAMDKKREEIKAFFDNPNGNNESFQQILRAVVKDIYEVDSGVIIKTYNKNNRMVELYARGGDSFLKNCDIYGSFRDRDDIVPPIDSDLFQTSQTSPIPESILKSYGSMYNTKAAYFQYGSTGLALPIPFGKREVVYIMQNKRSESIYGMSPVLLLQEIIMSLVYGASYNLDFYTSDIPDGMLEAIGANQKQIDGLRENLKSITRVKDEKTGFLRKIGFKIPIANVPTKFTPFRLDPKMLQIIEQQKWFTKLVWQCFGVNADSMGYTEESNKSVSESQTKLYQRKAVKPLLQLLKYHFDHELLSEFGPEVTKYLEWKWENYDLDEDIKKHTLYQMQLNMGIKTKEMIAKECGINWDDVKESEDDQIIDEEEEQPMPEPEKKSVSDKFENSLEKEMTLMLRERAKKLLNSFDEDPFKSLSKIN